MTSSITSQSHHRLKGRFLVPEVRRVFGELRGRVDGDILAITFTSDQRCLTVEDGGILRHWNPNNGNMTLASTLSEIETCWAFSPGGRFLASGSDGISIWDVNEGELIGKHEDPAWMTALVFSPDSRRLASGHDDHKVRLWDSQSGKLLRVFTGHHDEICAIAFSNDGRFLATASEDRTVLIWDTRTGDQAGKLEGHTDRVDDLAWSPNGLRIASAGWDTSVRVWDAKNGELLTMLNGQGECVHAVTFTPDGKWIVCGDSNGFIRVWDYEHLKVKGEWLAHRSPLRKLALNGRGDFAATGGLDRVISFVQIPTAEPVFTDDSPRSSVVSLAGLPEGNIAVVHREGMLSYFDNASGRAHSRLKKGTGSEPKSSPLQGIAVNEVPSSLYPPATPGHSLEQELVTAVSASSQGTLAVGTQSGNLGIIEKAGAQPTRLWNAHPNGPTRLIAFRPDGQEIATSTGSDGTLRIWNAQTGEPTLIIPEATHCGTVETIAYHPTLPIIAASGILWNDGGEGATVLWNTQAIKMHLSFARGATALAFSPDGKFLAGVGLDDSIIIWDLESARIVKELSGTDGSTNAIAFDPQGQVFVSASNDGGLRAWDIPSWRMTANIEVDARVMSLAFSADGESIVLGNANSACYVIDLASLL
jgi:WD40 repeat protein